MDLTAQYERSKIFFSRFGAPHDLFVLANMCATSSLWTHLMMKDYHGIRNILEVGCGTGTTTNQFLLTKPYNAQHYGIDRSEEMVHICTEKFGDKAMFLVGDAERLNDFENDSFDRYISNFVLDKNANPSNMLKECLRVLKPGGRAAFSVLGRPELSPGITIVDQIYDSFVPSQRRENDFNLSDKEKTIELVRSAGFSIVYAWYQNTTTPHSVDEHIKVFRNAQRFQIIDPELRERILEKIREELIKEFNEKSTPIYHETLLIIADK